MYLAFIHIGRYDIKARRHLACVQNGITQLGDWRMETWQLALRARCHVSIRQSPSLCNAILNTCPCLLAIWFHIHLCRSVGQEDDPFHNGFMTSWFKSCQNWCFYLKYNDQIWAQFCTCHDSLAAMTCAKLLSFLDWITTIKIRVKRIIMTVQWS